MTGYRQPGVGYRDHIGYRGVSVVVEPEPLHVLMTLSESVEAILDSIIEAIQQAVNASRTRREGLGTVKSVVRGDRARPMPELPSVWVVPQPAQFQQQTFGDEETWSMPVAVAALVKSDDPEVGGKTAQRIAAEARAAALKARAEDVAITDVLSESFDPTARSSERNRSLFWTDATIKVVFTVSG